MLVQLKTLPFLHKMTIYDFLVTICDYACFGQIVDLINAARGNVGTLCMSLIMDKVARGSIFKRFKRLGIFLDAPKHCKESECAVMRQSFD